MKASVTRASPCLRRLAPRHLKLLSAAATSRTLAAGEQLETDGALYLVAAGEVAVWTPPEPGGVSEVVGQEGPGSMFGSPLLGGEAEARVYRAATDVEAYAWSDADLARVFARAEGLERQLAVRLSLRARERELAALLRATPLFAHVSQSLVRWLLRTSTLELYEAGSRIVHEGDDGDAMFLIVSGEVAIGEQAPGAGYVARLHRADFFGEIALVQGSARTSSATALVDAEVLVVGKEAFDLLDERSPAFGHAVRLTAQRRLEVNVRGARDPELVWLVNNDRHCRTDRLAALLAHALAETGGGRVAEPGPLRSGGALRTAFESARAAGAAHVLCWTDWPDGAVPERLAREVADRAGSVVVVGGDAAAPFPRGAFGRVHHVVVSAPDGAAGPQPVRRDAIVLRAHASDLRRSRLDRVPGDARRGLLRVARAVSGRRVGVALGGGAAWGYAHVALVRALERAEIPIDMVVGVSMGSVVGAFYASQGLGGLDRLMGANIELSAAAIGAVASTQAVGLFMRRHIPQARIEDLGLPFAAVAVDARTAREKVFRHGSVAAAVRASCSLPGVFAPSILGGHRYLDGAVRHNVPASICIDAGADFVVACDVVPLPGVPRGHHRRGLTGRVLDMTQVNRLSDAVRSLYWLTSDSGQRQASVADAIFSPDLAEYEPWDFPRAKAIVARADEQLDEWLRATVARYAALARGGRADG
jgi:predicted acylesterase/phospholipase RssA/CRP-like cAMP-binding protein